MQSLSLVSKLAWIDRILQNSDTLSASRFLAGENSICSLLSLEMGNKLDMA